MYDTIMLILQCNLLQMHLDFLHETQYLKKMEDSAKYKDQPQLLKKVDQNKKQP